MRAIMLVGFLAAMIALVGLIISVFFLTQRLMGEADHSALVICAPIGIGLLVALLLQGGMMLLLTKRV